MCRATSAGITTVQEMTNAAILHCMRGESWQALRLFQEILEVDGDNALAKYNLGVIYAQGEGVEQDFAKAAELFQQAHALGNSDATANLGVIKAALMTRQEGRRQVSANFERLVLVCIEVDFCNQLLSHSELPCIHAY